MELPEGHKKLFDLSRDGFVTEDFKSRAEFTPNARDKNHLCPLMLVCMNGNLNSYRVLSAVEGIDVNAKDIYKRTPFLMAVMGKGSLDYPLEAYSKVCVAPIIISL